MSTTQGRSSRKRTTRHSSSHCTSTRPTPFLSCNSRSSRLRIYMYSI
jgi:hypothetical protein